MKKILLLLMLSVLLLFLSTPVSAENFTCLACHSAMKGKVKTDKGNLIELNIDEARFSVSVHGGFGCTTCHKNYKDNPHEQPKAGVSKEVTGLARLISSKAKTDPVAAAACSECHEETFKKITESVHGRNFIEKKESDGPLCHDCHGAPHYIVPAKSKESPVSQWKVVKTCGGCHEKEELAKKYNFGTHIIEKYEESFHGKKHALGHPGAPTCVNCHGSHGVKKWDDPASPVSWEKRIETCGKCHPGAGKKFVTAITHKPTGKDNPIPYYAEKTLIILTISVFVFVVGHVVLEALSEIRDRVFRKKKEEPHD